MRPPHFLRSKSLLAALIMLSTASVAVAQAPPSEGEQMRAYDLRRDSIISFYADRVDKTDYSAGGMFDVAANLQRGTNLEWCAARLDSMMVDPRGDMFWMYPFTTMMFAERGQMPKRIQDKIRDVWRTYQPYRGDTENHWALYYSTLYLAAEKYPDQPGNMWYTGKTSSENRDEAAEYLRSWMDLTTTIGQGEFDSPHYMRVYIAPMALLYAYAEDPEMRQRAGMMLDYLIADSAVETLDGLFGGGVARIYEREVISPWRAGGASKFGWLLWGNSPFSPNGEIYITAVSGYRPPPVLYAIATDRRTPYVHLEKKRTRHLFRHNAQQNPPVYKYVRMRPEYVLSSTQGGLLQPIQQQSWGLTWRSTDPTSERNAFFSNQPYSSPQEMGADFAEFEEFIIEIVVRSKTEYDSPDKITGGSPYEQIVQHEDALVALYDIPDGTRFPHINTFFSRDLKDVREDPSGWVFARGGDALIAYRPLQPYVWQNHVDNHDETIIHRRMMSPHLKNGVVLQVAPFSDYGSMDAFVAAVNALPLEVSTSETPSVQFTTLSGARIDATYGSIPRINGTDVDYANWPLFGGPYLNADVGSRMLDIGYGNMRRRLDFNTLSVTDWIENANTDPVQR